MNFYETLYKAHVLHVNQTSNCDYHDTRVSNAIHTVCLRLPAKIENNLRTPHVHSRAHCVSVVKLWLFTFSFQFSPTPDKYVLHFPSETDVFEVSNTIHCSMYWVERFLYNWYDQKKPLTSPFSNFVLCFFRVINIQHMLSIYTFWVSK